MNLSIVICLVKCSALLLECVRPTDCVEQEREWCDHRQQPQAGTEVRNNESFSLMLPIYKILRIQTEKEGEGFLSRLSITQVVEEVKHRAW